MSINIKDAINSSITFFEIKKYMEELADELHIQYDVISISYFDTNYNEYLYVICNFLRTENYPDDDEFYDVIDTKTFNIKFKDGSLQSVKSYLEESEKNEYIKACKNKLFFSKKSLQKTQEKLKDSKNNTNTLLKDIEFYQNHIADLENELRKLNEI